MVEHIIALLKNNLRVIIPDFGAFIVRQKEPEVIVFNEFLRYNDGLLIDFISKSEQIEKEIAEQKVTEFAEESSKTLESGKVVQIKGLGSLSRDPSGKINFIAESSASGKEKPGIKKESNKRTDKKPLERGSIEQPASDNIKKETESISSPLDADGTNKALEIKDNKVSDKYKERPVGKDETKSEDKEELKPELKQEAKPEVKSAEDSDGHTENKPQEIVEGSPVAKTKVKPTAKDQTIEGTRPEGETKGLSEVAPKTKPGMVSKDKAESKPGIDKKTEQRSSEKASLEIQAEGETYQHLTEKPLPTPTVRKTSTINQILTWIGIFLMANIIILAWFLYRDQIRGLFGGEEGTEVLMDSLVVEEQAGQAFKLTEEDTTPVIEVPPALEEHVVPSIQAGQPKYYIVAGCFREEANADALVQTLRSKGFNAEKFGRIGNLHAVSYSTFVNQAEALRELERIRKEEQPEAWMTRF